jgi:hypothetical protein
MITPVVVVVASISSGGVGGEAVELVAAAGAEDERVNAQRVLVDEPEGYERADECTAPEHVEVVAGRLLELSTAAGTSPPSSVELGQGRARSAWSTRRTWECR